MMLNIKLLCVIFFIGFNLNTFPQDGFQLQNGKSDKIHFRFVNNLIVIPVSVNGVSLSFLLDTGVSKPIIFNFFNLKEELSIHETELLLLQGLGDDKPIEALKSSNNTVIIGEAINLNQDLYAIIDASINFAPSLGIPIHGIIGYDVFKDFIVEINYSRNFIKLHNPITYDTKLSRKWKTSDLIFYNKKPIIKASVTNRNQVVPVNLLIDTGGSDALWVFENSSESLNIPTYAFDDFLGKGLSGNIYGKRSVFESFRLKDFQLNMVNVSFPDSSSIQKTKINKLRNGSLLGDVLHRFNWIFNYKFKIVPELVISDVRPDSPADKAGLKNGDTVLSINDQNQHSLTLQKAIAQFFGIDGKRIRMTIEREGVVMKFQFKLRDLLHKKSTN